MTYGGHHKLVGTADQDYQIAVDTLVIPFLAGPVVGAVVGSLLPWIALTAAIPSAPNITLAGSTLTLQMREDYNFRPGTVILPKTTVEGGAARWDVKLESWTEATKRLVFRTFNAAGALTAPPAGVGLHLVFVHRY